MEMHEVTMLVILFLTAAGFFVMSYLHFSEKGPLLNNAALFATEEERAKLDKKPYYRQSAISFALLGVIFLMIALAVLLKAGWLYHGVWIVSLATVVYAVASTIKLQR